MAKYLILTANIGGKDFMSDPKNIFEDCDYLAILDKSYDLKVWKEYKYFNFSNLDKYSNRRNAKLYKVMCSVLFPEYEYILWLDANHELLQHPKNIIDEYGDFDLLLFKHPHRNCLYQEIMVASNGIGLDLKNNLITQENYYREQGMPENYGLFEMTCFMQKNNEKNKTLNLMWWEQICKFSSRDQCSFTYCLWKSGLDLQIKTFSGFANMYAGGSKYFGERGHAIQG